MRHAIGMTGRFESSDRIILDEPLPETFSKKRVLTKVEKAHEVKNQSFRDLGEAETWFDAQ